MKTNLLKKLLTALITAVILVNPIQVMAQDSKEGSVADESLQDLTTVIGSGVVGAVLGLSTLSFVDKPKDHFKNIAIGGAIGMVIGVGLVIFNQANKSGASLSENKLPLSPESFEGLARSEFSEQKIAENYLMQPTFGYNFTF